jgi:hypothetical protein
MDVDWSRFVGSGEFALPVGRWEGQCACQLLPLLENSTVTVKRFRSHPIEAQVTTEHPHVVSNLDDIFGL